MKYLFVTINLFTLVGIFLIIGTSFADNYSGHVMGVYWLSLIIGTIQIRKEELFNAMFPIVSVCCLVILALSVS